MDTYETGLRCQDVNSGLRTFDASSPSFIPLKKTRLVGMAADLAALLRDIPIVSNISALEGVAAAELDIPPLSFDAVLEALESVEFVELTRKRNGEVSGLTTTVPTYRSAYETLGKNWQERQPTQLEMEIVAVVNRLAQGPLTIESLPSVTGIDKGDISQVVGLGNQAQLIQSMTTADGTILYSPYTAFENPALLGQLVGQHGSDRLLSEFDSLRNHQGLPVRQENHPLLYEAVGRGLLLAPSVELPNGGYQPFATLPYTLDRDLLLGKKPVLEKALAVVACIRCGEHFGGYSDLPSAYAAINRLLRDGELNPHSSSRRQYRLMRDKGIIRYGEDPLPGGRWVVPTLIDTADNRRALEIARDLIMEGESMAGRDARSARDALSEDGSYKTPMKTVALQKPRIQVPESEYSDIIAAVMGYGTA